MAEIALQYTEEIVGAGHPTKADTINRLFIAGGARVNDGTVNYELFNEQVAAPSTAAGQVAVFAMEIDGVVRPVFRAESDGAVQELGLSVEVVAQGRADAPSFPIATGTYDQDEHLAMVFPTFPASVVRIVGGYYTWDGTQIAGGAWGTALQPFAVGVTWQIWHFRGLSSAIQHVAASISPAAANGWAEADVAITAINDYTKAMVIPCHFGGVETDTANGEIYDKHTYLTSNSNLRHRYYRYYGSGAYPTISAPAVVVPLR